MINAIKGISVKRELSGGGGEEEDITADSIACARQAGVPLLVAANKIDLETADTNRVLLDLAGYEVLTEDLGVALLLVG